MKAKFRKLIYLKKLDFKTISKLFSTRKIRIIAVLLAAFFILNSCNKFIENLKDSSKEIGGNLVEGMTDKLTSDSTKQNIDQLIGRITKTITDSLSKERLAKIGVDTLSEIIGKKVMEGVGKGLDDAILKAQIDSFFNNTSTQGKLAIKEIFGGLTDDENRERLTQFLAESLNGSLNDNFERRLRSLSTGLLDSVITDARLEQLKTQLIGQSMGDSLNARLDSAIGIIINRINKDLKPIVEEDELSFVQKWVKQLLLFGGLIALGLIAFFWYQKNKSLRIAQLLMAQINDMPNQNAYDELTGRITRVARNHNVEAVIRDILKENGMLGGADWKAEKENNNQ